MIWRIHLHRTRISFSSFDSAGNGLLTERELESYILQEIPASAQLNQLDENFYPTYVVYAGTPCSSPEVLRAHHPRFSVLIKSSAQVFLFPRSNTPRAGENSGHHGLRYSSGAARFKRERSGFRAGKRKLVLRLVSHKGAFRVITHQLLPKKKRRPSAYRLLSNFYVSRLGQAV